MRVAIFHNYLDNIGGAEMVTLTLARELDATIYTTNIDHEKIGKMGFSDVNIVSIGRVPLNPPFRQQIAFLKFRFLDLKGKYDQYICMGDWAMSGCVLNKPNLWYVHSPIRELWDLKDYVRKELCSFWQRPFFDMWVWINRRMNKKYVESVDTLVCNSTNTQKRVKKYLGKSAEVIHPPVEMNDFKHGLSMEYWLSVNRLLPPKRIDIQIEAFRTMPDKELVIIGSFERSKHFLDYYKKIAKDLPSNVQIMSFVDRNELLFQYAHCEGFIATAMDEDFGMTPVEAMASGKTVVASNEGGYKESVINGVTGILIDDITSEKIIDAVNQISGKSESFKEACIIRAKEFDTKTFVKKIKKAIDGDVIFS